MTEEQKNEVAEAEVVPKHLTEVADEIAAISTQYERKGMEALWAVSEILNNKLEKEHGERSINMLAGILSDRWGEGYSVANLYQIQRVADTFTKVEFDELAAVDGITATKIKDVLNNKTFKEVGKDRIMAFLKANPTLSTREIKAIIQHPDRVLEDGTVRPLEETQVGGEGEGDMGGAGGGLDGPAPGSSGSPMRAIRKFVKQAESLGDTLTDIQFAIKEFEPDSDKMLEKFVEELQEMHEQMKNVHGLMEAVVGETGAYIDGDPVKAFKEKSDKEAAEKEAKAAAAKADAEKRAKEKAELKEKKKAEAAEKKDEESSEEDIEARKKALVAEATKKALEAKKRKTGDSPE